MSFPSATWVAMPDQRYNFHVRWGDISRNICTIQIGEIRENEHYNSASLGTFLHSTVSRAPEP